MKWKRPSGREIETNDAESTIESCKAMGWEPMGSAPAVEPVTEDWDSTKGPEPEGWGSSEPGEESTPKPEKTVKRKRGK